MLKTLRKSVSNKVALTGAAALCASLAFSSTAFSFGVERACYPVADGEQADIKASYTPEDFSAINSGLNPADISSNFQIVQDGSAVKSGINGATLHSGSATFDSPARTQSDETHTVNLQHPDGRVAQSASYRLVKFGPESTTFTVAPGGQFTVEFHGGNVYQQSEFQILQQNTASVKVLASQALSAPTGDCRTISSTIQLGDAAEGTYPARITNVDPIGNGAMENLDVTLVVTGSGSGGTGGSNGTGGSGGSGGSDSLSCSSKGIKAIDEVSDIKNCYKQLKKSCKKSAKKGKGRKSKRVRRKREKSCVKKSKKRLKKQCKSLGGKLKGSKCRIS